MIEFRPLTPDYYSNFLSLYRASFPIEEQRPYANEAELEDFLKTHDGIFSITAVFLDNSFAGFITTWNFPGYIYGEHAAIDPTMRNNGIGAKMFTHLFESTNKGVLIEVEPAGSTPMADRRMAFYKRIGFVERAEISYTQPPYAPGLDAVALSIMTHGNVDLTDPVKAFTPLAQEVYKYPSPMVSLN